MRIIAFVLDPRVIERIQGHIDEPCDPLKVLPARSPPRWEIPVDQEVGLEFNQDPGAGSWIELGQSGPVESGSWD